MKTNYFLKRKIVGITCWIATACSALIINQTNAFAETEPLSAAKVQSTAVSSLETNPLTEPSVQKKMQEPPEKATSVLEERSTQTSVPATVIDKIVDSDPTPDDTEEYGTIVSEKLTGSISIYTTVRGDNLRLIASKLGVSRQQLMEMNNLNQKSTVKAGQQLKYNNLKIIPEHAKNGIIINIPDRTLYYFSNGKLAISLPVALGMGRKSKKFDWETPTGKFKIVSKQKNPTWHVPPSIQSEMEANGKEVIKEIPPGPNNPLGKYAIKTSLPGILIHSTTKPGSIYSFASHGCIRVDPKRIEELFKEVKVNTPGVIIYKPVKLAVTEQGQIFLEVHQDIYKKGSKLDQEAKKLIEKHKLSELVDWDKVKEVISEKSGIAENISL